MDTGSRQENASKNLEPRFDSIETEKALVPAGVRRPVRRLVRPGRRQLFLLLGLWPAGVLPAANGEGVAPPFLMFLSAFGFFFSLLLRI